MRIIGGEYGGRGLTAPKGDATRPTTDRVREALFSALAARRSFADCAVLDLFAGTGALGLEALSRGASQAFFVENARPALHALSNNIETLGVGACAQILNTDATRLPPAPVPCGLVFADPPYGKGLGPRALAAAHAKGWLAPDAIIVLEEDHRHELVLPEGITQTDRRQYGDTVLVFAAVNFLA